MESDGAFQGHPGPCEDPRRAGLEAQRAGTSQGEMLSTGMKQTNTGAFQEAVHTGGRLSRAKGGGQTRKRRGRRQRRKLGERAEGRQ